MKTKTKRNPSRFMSLDVLPSPEGYLEGTILSCRSDGQDYMLAKGNWVVFQSFDKLLQKTKSQIEEPAAPVLESSIYLKPIERKLTM